MISLHREWVENLKIILSLVEHFFSQCTIFGRPTCATTNVSIEVVLDLLHCWFSIFFKQAIFRGYREQADLNFDFLL